MNMGNRSGGRGGGGGCGCGSGSGSGCECECECGCRCVGGCGADCACADACAGVVTLDAPRPRAGLDAVGVRIGEYGRFKAAACLALSMSTPQGAALQRLGTRDPSDPAIALIDAWAIAADVLTFYRERLTNEGYLRCARNERSLRWLAAEVGYKPRPGVAATTWLAYLLDTKAAPVQIPAGAKAQSTPTGSEQMQLFETLDALDAHPDGSEMRPRLMRVPAIEAFQALSRTTLRLSGTSTSVHPGERIVFVFDNGWNGQVLREVAAIRLDTPDDAIEVLLVPKLTPLQAAELSTAMADIPPQQGEPAGFMLLRAIVTSFLLGGSAADAAIQTGALKDGGIPNLKNAAQRFIRLFTSFAKLQVSAPIQITGGEIDDVLGSIEALGLPQRADAQRSATEALGPDSPLRGTLLGQLSAPLKNLLYEAWRAMPAKGSIPARIPDVYIVHANANAYGSTAPLKIFDRFVDWPTAALDQSPGAAYLDAVYPNVLRGSLVIIDVPVTVKAVVNAQPPAARLALAEPTTDMTRTIRIGRVASAQTLGRSDYGSNAQVTALNLVDFETGQAAIQIVDPDADFNALRRTVYGVRSEQVKLAPEAITADVRGDTIQMDKLFDWIRVGRRIIVQGERTDIIVNKLPLPGIVDAELAQVTGVDQMTYLNSPGDTLHTVLSLASPLAHTYKRSTVTVFGNVVEATHGESVSETIGSGIASARQQTFALRRAPLTFLPAVTTSGVQGTQAIRVNDVRWSAVDSLLDAGATDRAYEMATDEFGVATFAFGDGVFGARLPSGQGNVRAIYRAGIGAVGNVGAAQINQPVTRPLGVIGVVNPLAATGGADRDGGERIRANAPLAAQSLAPSARLVSMADYGYFARRFAGVGQAAVRKLADGAFECVHVTLAGVGDAPLRDVDDLVASLDASYSEFGDPVLPVVIQVRELVALFIQARVAVSPERDWKLVEQAIRTRLLDTFSFERRRLGQSVYLSEVIAAIQCVDGVDWVDVDMLGGVSEVDLRNEKLLGEAVQELHDQISSGQVKTALKVRLAGLAKKNAPSPFVPAQIAYLMPGVADTLVLNKI